MVLALGAIIAAGVTSVVGPIAFVGLLAPHAASLLGARKARDQVLLAAVIGAILLVVSDWLGRSAFFPLQLPAGATASILGGVYFTILLAGSSRRVVASTSMPR